MGIDVASTNEAQDRNLIPIFVIVFLMLCALTGISYWIAHSYLMENRWVGWTAMMAVSIAKASLVVMVFMHLWWERAWKYVLTLPALILAGLLVILLVPDVGYRGATYSRERHQNAPAIQLESGLGTSDQTRSKQE